MKNVPASKNVLSRLRIDPFILGILCSVAIACLLPARGGAAPVAEDATTVAIGLLFFLYGSRLSPAEALAGVRHWRLHLTVFSATFVMFPLLGVLARVLVPTVLTPQLYVGVLFLCMLPSTVQSSIAFTSIAKGNVAAAVCSASFSSIIGIVLTPLLVAWLINTSGGGFSAHSILDIVLQLLVPFLLGQLTRRWTADWIGAHKKVLSVVDRGSILLVVYTAFSAGVVAGIWHQLTVLRFAGLIAVNSLLLVLALCITTFAARRLGFGRADRITIVFCGSKKSLAAGLPMAAVLFGHGAALGLIVLPLMLFHQIQLMVCAALARRWGARVPVEPAVPAVGVTVSTE
ncbi:MAG TPA: bile acid:sodium symporter family protein [Pseudonocardiaceae bacterium]|jgi:sodium/bile acid cotransporter 7|nr:bile acid:sodium symporter family protein [Pseudonocardiaceae bacterium]